MRMRVRRCGCVRERLRMFARPKDSSSTVSIRDKGGGRFRLLLRTCQYVLHIRSRRSTLTFRDYRWMLPHHSYDNSKHTPSLHEPIGVI